MSTQSIAKTEELYALTLLAADAAFYQGEDEDERHILLFINQSWHCDCGSDRESPDQECIHLQRLHQFLATGL